MPGRIPNFFSCTFQLVLIRKSKLIFADGRQRLSADLPDDIGHEDDQKTGRDERKRPEGAVDEVFAAARGLTDRFGGPSECERMT